MAVDQASIDLVYALSEKDNKDIVERIDTRHGRHQLDYMEALGMGSRAYNLVEI